MRFLIFIFRRHSVRLCFYYTRFVHNLYLRIFTAHTQSIIMTTRSNKLNANPSKEDLIPTLRDYTYNRKSYTSILVDVLYDEKDSIQPNSYIRQFVEFINIQKFDFDQKSVLKNSINVLLSLNIPNMFEEYKNDIKKLFDLNYMFYFTDINDSSQFDNFYNNIQQETVLIVKMKQLIRSKQDMLYTFLLPESFTYFLTCYNINYEMKEFFMECKDREIKRIYGKNLPDQNINVNLYNVLLMIKSLARNNIYIPTVVNLEELKPSLVSSSTIYNNSANDFRSDIIEFCQTYFRYGVNDKLITIMNKLINKSGNLDFATINKFNVLQSFVTLVFDIFKIELKANMNLSNVDFRTLFQSIKPTTDDIFTLFYMKKLNIEHELATLYISKVRLCYPKTDNLEQEVLEALDYPIEQAL